MSRRYHHRKTYRLSARSSSLALPLVILLAYGLWMNNEVMLQVEYIAKIGLLMGIGIVCAVILVRLYKKVQSWRRNHNPNMAIIDRMSGLEFERYVARLLKKSGLQTHPFN